MTETLPTRERILEAARGCFSQFGFTKTSMEDIARDAGMSRGNVYRHFPDKDSLFRAVSREQAREFLEVVRERTAKLPTLTEQIEEVAQLTSEFVFDSPVRSAMAKHGDAFGRALTVDSGELISMALEAVSPLIEAAIDRGEVRSDLDVPHAAEWIIRIVMSLVSTPSITFDGDDPAQRRAFIREFLGPGLR